jgi:proliferating cell nuclear antigen
MKLMDIDSDTLGIPDTDYDARVTMRASEFSRIVRDLSLLGESVRIEVTKEGVRFASDGEAANGNVLLKQTEAARERYADYGKEDEEGDAEGDEEGAKKTGKVKKEKVKKEAEADDVEMEEGNEDEEFKVKSDDEGEEEAQDEEESSSKKKRKKSSANVRLLLFFSFSPTDGQNRVGNQRKK